MKLPEQPEYDVTFAHKRNGSRRVVRVMLSVPEAAFLKSQRRLFAGHTSHFDGPIANKFASDRAYVNLPACYEQVRCKRVVSSRA